MSPDEAIKIVNSKAQGRTRYEGQEDFLDEVLVAEIERLRNKQPEIKSLIRNIKMNKTYLFLAFLFYFLSAACFGFVLGVLF